MLVVLILALGSFAIRQPAENAVLTDASALIVHVPNRFVQAYLVEYFIDGRPWDGAVVTNGYIGQLDVRRLEDGLHHMRAVLYDHFNAPLAEHSVAFYVKNTPIDSPYIVALGNDAGGVILVRWAYRKEDLATPLAHVVNCTNACDIPASGRFFMLPIYLDAFGRHHASAAPADAIKIGDQ